MKMNSFWKMIPVAAFAAFTFVACDSGSSSDSDAADSSSSAAAQSSGSSSSGMESGGSSAALSSSVAALSSSSVAGSSSSVAKSSSSVAASSSSVVKSSSSVAGSSSSKANWAYLNPAISYGEFTDSRDKQVYKTVKIGTQTWMAENLNYAVDSSWCYENSADNCAEFGRLYTWTGAMNIASTYQSASASAVINTVHQGACPVGWHVPRGSEWDVLAVAVGGILINYGDYDLAGKMLKSASGWNGDGNGTDGYGFSALPAGYRDGNGDFDTGRHYAYFWSATEINEDIAIGWYLYYYALMRTYYSSKVNAFSVRCVQDF